MAKLRVSIDELEAILQGDEPTSVYSEVDELLDEAKAAGVDPDTIAIMLDKAVDFRVLVPGPVGVVLELVDGPAFKAGAKAIGKELRKLLTPEGRAKAKAKRAKKKAKRRRKKLARQNTGAGDAVE